MTKNQSNTGNIIIYIVVGVLVLFLFLKFVGPKIGIKIFEKKSNDMEYTHADGFDRALNVAEQFNKTRLAIYDEQALKDAIASVDKNNEVKIPKINFSRKMALFVTSKTRETGGYKTRIKKIYQDKDDLVVVIRDEEPGDTCITTEQLNLPMDLVILDKTDLSVEFKVETQTKECN